VKNFVSKARSFVRALPLSQVKSAKANGSAFVGGADCVGRVALAAEDGTEVGWTVDATGGAAAELEGGAAVFGGAVAEIAAVADSGAPGFFPSSSATRFSNFSTRSRSQRSRSVNSGGAEGLAEFVALEEESGLGLSSAKEKLAQHANNNEQARTILKKSTRIYFSWKCGQRCGVVLDAFEERKTQDKALLPSEVSEGGVRKT
jgi:hypothetical protein